MIPGPVLRAFDLDVDIPLRPMGQVFVAGGLVLKRAEDDEEAAWVAETLSHLEPPGIRVARPVRASDGRWVVDGWTASERVAGHVTRDWGEVLRAGAAFHLATAGLPRPGLLDRRTHRWAVADRMAWGEEPLPAERPPSVDALVARLSPIDLPDQVVHGDLSGNVLAAPGLAPAVIDFSPYWRPAGWAAAVVVVDAVAWWRAPLALVDALEPGGRDQLLARATLFRLLCEPPTGAHLDWVDHLCRRLDGAT